MLGQGRLGLALAKNLHQQGLSVFSWSRSPKHLEWPTQSFSKFKDFDLSKIDKLIIASGSSSPKSISIADEHSRTITHFLRMSSEFSGQVYYLSSGAVYGDCLYAMRETDSCKPSTVYASAKHSTELLLKDLLGSNLSVFRIGNIVPQKSDFGIFAMINNSLSKKSPITFFGDPLDCRDYIGENDLLQVLNSLIMSESNFNLLNVGSGVSISLLEIAQMLNDIYDDDIDVVWNPRSKYDVAKTMLDVNSLKNLTDFSLSNPKELISKILEQS